MAERGLEPSPAAVAALPPEVRAQLAELELELSEGDITQKGYEKKRSKLLSPYSPQTQETDSIGQKERNQTPAPTAAQTSAPSKYHRSRSGGARDERYRSDIHTEAVQAALAKHKEQKMALPMPTKRRSTFVQSPADACTPPDTSSASEDEGSLRRQAALSAALQQSLQNAESWINRSIQGSSTSSSASSTLSHGEVKGTSGSLADVFANTRIENVSAPPDVTATTSSSSSSLRPANIDLPPSGIVKGMHKGSNRSSLMDTADGVPVNSRVSTKIQQLLNTLKRPKRPPLKEFFVDDSEEIVEVPQPDPNQPKPEGRQMTPVKGEPLGVICNWPPALESALQRWGSTQAKCPCLTGLDVTGKPVYTLTYGKLWSRSLKLAYTLLNKLGTKNEPVLKPGDRVALVYPNNDPVMFMVAFYGCLLAEVIPVPIEVPLTRKDAGGQQIGFLLGSCGIALALTSEICLKGLPKTQNGEIVQFKGWPRLKWVVTDSKYLSKPPKDWQPHISPAGTEPAYIEYKTSKEGSVMGVTVSRLAMLSQCQALSQACNYSEGETVVNVLDFKKDAGLWHGMFANVMNKMHTISVPYSVMKTCPLSWVQRVHAHKAKVALVKCRDLHWAMMAHRDQRDVSLSSLRMLIVTDGANPWSVSSCDAFLSLFQSHGLKPEAICPCATSAEAMTVAIRRPGVPGAPLPGRAILSMNGLSYGVIRVNTEDKNSALTVQDVGHVMPGGMMCIVKPDGLPQLCRTDEIGEICVSSRTGGMMYFGLAGVTKNTFEVIPVTSSGSPVGDVPFIRSGLLGFVGPGSLVFVVGKMDGLLMVSGRRHNADDIVATGLAVESIKTVYRGRIAVFSVSVFYDERIVVVAEQRPDASEEDSFQWMSRVLQAIDSIHQVGVYCLALVPANTLPKTPLGGIHISQTKQLFLEGSLHPCNILMCPHTCVTNLPKPRQKQPGVGPASVMVGNLVAGKRIAQAAGRDLGQIEENDLVRKHQFLAEILQWRAQATPDHVLFMLLNAKGTTVCTASCLQLHKRAERIASVLGDKGHLNAGDNVVLLYPPGIELIAAFYGCLYAGCIPVTVRPPHAQNLTATLPTVRMVVDVSKAACVLTTQTLMRLLKSREAAAAVDVKTWPAIIDTDDLPRKRLPQLYKPPTPEMLAYLDFSVSTTGMLTGVKMSHSAVNALCRAIKLQCELYSSRQIAICLDPYCGLGFALWCLCSVYSGHQSVLIPPMELENNLFLWLATVNQYKIRDTFCSYSVMELCTKGLGNQVEVLKTRGINLSCIRTCVVVAEERPRVSLQQSFSKLFKDIGLSPRAVSTTFGSRVNVATPSRAGAGRRVLGGPAGVVGGKMASVGLQFQASAGDADPQSRPLLLLGQLQHLHRVPWSHVRGKLQPRVTEELWQAALATLNPNPTDSCPLYLNCATVAALPSRVSRHNSPSAAHFITRLVRTCLPPGTHRCILMVCEQTEVFASACALARAFPLFTHRSGASRRAEKRTVMVEFFLVGQDNGPVEVSTLQCLTNATEGVRLAARIVDTPCNEMNTDIFLEEIIQVGKELGITPTIIRDEQLKTKGFGGIYGVGKAALHPPALAILSHTPDGATQTIAWVGKGIVYDTGGLSIKGKTTMPGMKRDCGGAAAVLGAFRAAIKQGFKDNLHAVFCLAENAVGPNATRPDDIHLLYSGKTVEINNTDAEGRLVLADGVSYACKDLGADIIVDMATLTGAQGIATGKYHAAVLTNSAEWEAACVKAGRKCGDLVHPLVYCPELHFSEFTSAVADMKNSVADRDNSPSSCAGLFIASHIGFDWPGVWVHLDIAAPVHAGERATGFGVALLLALFGRASEDPLLNLVSPLDCEVDAQEGDNMGRDSKRRRLV